MPEDKDCFGEHGENDKDCQDCDKADACEEQTPPESVDGNSIDPYAFVFGAGVFYMWRHDLFSALIGGIGFSLGFRRIGKESPFKKVVKVGVILLILVNVLGFIWGCYEGSRPAGESNVVGFFFVDENELELDGMAYLDDEEVGKTQDGGTFLLRSHFDDGRTHVLRFEPESSDEYCEYGVSKEMLTENAFFVEC